MTVSRLRNELTETELLYYAAYYELKSEREKQEMQRAKMTRR